MATKKNSTIVDPSSGVRPTSNSSGRSPTVFECCRDPGLTLTSRSLVFDCGGEISVHGYRSPQPRSIRDDNDFRSHEDINLLSKSVPSLQILCLLPAFYLYGTLAALIHFHNALWLDLSLEFVSLLPFLAVSRVLSYEKFPNEMYDHKKDSGGEMHIPLSHMKTRASVYVYARICLSILLRSQSAWHDMDSSPSCIDAGRDCYSPVAHEIYHEGDVPLPKVSRVQQSFGVQVNKVTSGC